MEPPQSGRSSVLPPQDPSPCSLTTVFDLSRKGEESLLKTNSMDSLHVAKGPSWYSINRGTNKGPPFTEKDSNHAPMPIEQIHSDDAFSNTTVTLSYVNRSHVFSSHDSLSQLHPLCGVSSVSGKRPHRPSSFERDPLLTDVGRGGLCVEFGQGFLTHTVKPVGLAPDSAVCETQEPPPLIETVSGTHVEQPGVEMNGKQAGSPWVMDSIELSHGDCSEKCASSQEEDKDGSVQNGMDSGPWILVSHEEKSPESPSVGTEGVPKMGDSEVLLLISGTADPGLLQDNSGPRPFLSSSFNGDYVSPLEDPLSPSSPSADDMEDVFILPQTLNSPSGDHSLADEAASATEENRVEPEPGPDPSLTESTLTSVPGARSQPSSPSDDVMEIPTGSNGVLAASSAVQEPCVEPPAMSNGESVCGETASDTPRKFRTPDLLNGKTQESGRTIERKTLPPRLRRGMRLGAIVQNIAPSRYNAHSAKKYCSPETQAHQAHSVSADRGIFRSLCSQNHEGKTESPAEQFTVNTGSSQEDTGNIYQDHCNSKSTSGSDHANISKLQRYNTSSKPSKPPDSNSLETEKEQHCSSPAKCSPRRARRRALPVSEVCQKSPTKQLRASASSKSARAAKKSPKPKRKRKKRSAGQPSMFSPKEPEIKLKYVNYKEEKRDKCEAFSPFVRVEMKECASCAIINYPEEESARLKKGRQLACSSFASRAVPSTSCLQLGRLDTESKRRSSLVCCLCRKSANFPDLGDLHGPYHPNSFRPDLKARLGPKEEDSDSDSLCSLLGGKCARAAGSWPQRPGHRLQQKGMLGASRRLGSDGDCSHSPPAKRSRRESASENWYSPPVVPLDTGEYWVHEDCGVWSAGVFLVKGKLYGLEEAVRLAKEMVCSKCHTVGATLGCLFKGCPNKYHYICAVKSGCVLDENNFSMKCTKHKNKTVRASFVSWRDDR